MPVQDKTAEYMSLPDSTPREQKEKSKIMILDLLRSLVNQIESDEWTPAAFIGVFVEAGEERKILRAEAGQTLRYDLIGALEKAKQTLITDLTRKEVIEDQKQVDKSDILTLLGELGAFAQTQASRNPRPSSIEEDVADNEG